jgi:hypothetical protein
VGRGDSVDDEVEAASVADHFVGVAGDDDFTGAKQSRFVG